MPFAFTGTIEKVAIDLKPVTDAKAREPRREKTAAAVRT